jgi:hypothetical protein
MTTYVLRHGKLVEKAKAFYHEGGGAAYVISDTQDLLWHPVANVYTDSKSQFRKMTVAAGCRELGNDVNYNPKRSAPKLDKRQRAVDIKRAIDQLRSGYRGP